MGCRLVVVLAALGTALFPSAGLAMDGQLPEHPLTLDDCVSLALERSPSLVAARQGVMSTEAGLRGALSTYYPTATLNVIQGRTGGSSFVETAAGTIGFTTSTTRRESDVTLRYNLWESGRKESVRRARYALGASRADERSAVEGLILSVSRLYYAALAEEQLVRVAEATLTAARDHENLVRARAGVGMAAPVDVVPAEADTAAAEFGLLQAENSAAIAKARLKSEMGAPPTYRLQLAPAGPSPDEARVPSLEESLELALANRPEAVSLQESVAAAEEAVRQAEAVRPGIIRVSAEYVRGIAGPREGESWAATAALTAYLFEGGGRRANVDGARARLRSLEAQQQQLVNSIGLEVESALLDVETARKSLEAAERAVASAEAQLAAAEGKYREGVGIFVEILDAQEAATRARTNRVQAIYNYRVALVALRRAMGMLAETGARGG